MSNDIFIRMLIRDLSSRLPFTNVAIDTSDECIVPVMIIIAVFWIIDDKKRINNNINEWLICYDERYNK